MWKYWKKNRKNKFCSQNDALIYPIKLDSFDVWTTENIKERYEYSINWVKKEKSVKEMHCHHVKNMEYHSLQISLSTVKCSRR